MSFIYLLIIDIFLVNFVTPFLLKGEGGEWKEFGDATTPVRILYPFIIYFHDGGAIFLDYRLARTRDEHGVAEVNFRNPFQKHHLYTHVC